MDRYLTKVYFNRPGQEPIEIASLAVYAEGPLAAYAKGVGFIQGKITAEVVGKMGPDADDRFQDGVVE